MPNDIKSGAGKADTASLLGLNVALQKKNKQRDLDSLAHLELDAGVGYSTPVSGHKATDHEVVAATPLVTRQPQPVGYVKNTGKLRLPDGTLANYESRIIAGSDLEMVQIYKGNPRATTNADVTGLRKKVLLTGGNIIAVIARILPDGTVEVIAGSRRTKAVKEEQLSLLANVIVDEISEVNARQLAYIENDGREDPDIFDEAAFFLSTFETYKVERLVSTVEDFGKLFSMSKVNMGRYLNIATIPSWLTSMCPRFTSDLQGAVKPTWSLRKAEELYQTHKASAEQLEGEIRSKLTQHQFTNPEDVLAAIKRALKSPVVGKAKSALQFGGKDIGYYEEGKRKKTLTIHLTEDAPDGLISDIKKLIDKLSEGN